MFATVCRAYFGGLMARFLKSRFDSVSIEYETPQDLFDKYDAEFHFDIDLAANSENTKCVKFYSKEDNSLSKSWEGVCWLNPPYGRELPKWIAKAYHSAKVGKATVVMLIPARTNTAWWHDICMKGEIRFIRGRPKFNGGKHGLPFPLAIVIFKPQLSPYDLFTL